MAEEENEKPKPAESPAVAAAAAVRETAKWTLAALGGIGAALVAGVSLADFGAVSGLPLLLSIIAVLAGLLAIAWAIRATALILLPRDTTLRQLKYEEDKWTLESDAKKKAKNYPATNFLRSNPELLLGQATISEVLDRQTQAFSNFRGKEDAWQADDTPDTHAALVAAKDEGDNVANIVSQILAWGHYAQLRREANNALTRIIAAALIAGIGILTFASAAHPSDPPDTDDMRGVNLSGLTLSGANLSGADLAGASFAKSDLSEANLKGADLSHADLTDATGLDTAKLTGVIWDETVCPDGKNSKAVGGTCQAHLEPLVDE